MKELYNYRHKPINFNIDFSSLFLDKNDNFCKNEKKKEPTNIQKEEDWKVSKIEDVKEICLTNNILFDMHPIMILIGDKKTIMLKYSIIYKGVDNFEVSISKIIINIDEEYLLGQAKKKI